MNSSLLELTSDQCPHSLKQAKIAKSSLSKLSSFSSAQVRDWGRYFTGWSSPSFSKHWDHKAPYIGSATSVLESKQKLFFQWLKLLIELPVPQLQGVLICQVVNWLGGWQAVMDEQLIEIGESNQMLKFVEVLGCHPVDNRFWLGWVHLYLVVGDAQTQAFDFGPQRFHSPLISATGCSSSSTWGSSVNACLRSIVFFL